MDALCPQIERLVSCNTCGGQALPPYQLCAVAHVACPACTKYQSRCACGWRFLKRSNTTFNWLVSAMKLRCKYRANDMMDGGPPTPGQVDCANGWYTVEELREHYQTGCMRNLFKCPMKNCGYVARVDTITTHYDTDHGPLPPISPDMNCVTFQLPAKRKVETIKKIFNGYFMFSVKPRRRRHKDINSLLSMQNINPSDRFHYTYTATQESHQKMLTVTVSLVEARKVETIKKIFNGYFMFSVKLRRRWHKDINSLLSMQNINPSDRFHYTYTATQESHQKMLTVTVSLVEAYSPPTHNIV